MSEDNNDQYEKLAKKLHDKCKKCKKSFPISDLRYGPNSYGHGTHSDDDCGVCDSCHDGDSSDNDSSGSDGGDSGGGDSSGGE